MKKILLLILLCVVTGLTPHVFAADGFTALAPIPGLTDMSPTTVIGPDSLANFFNNLYKYAVGMAAILAVIMIIWSGLEVATNRENVSSMLESKGRIYNAIFGLILVLSPVLVFSIINPSILNLSLNLPRIKPGINPVAVSNVSTSGGSVPTSAEIDATSGCTSDKGTLLKQASCPTWEAAQKFVALCKTGVGTIPNTTYGHYDPMCDTRTGSITGPYSFANTRGTAEARENGIPLLTSYYQPIASTPDNPNNGNAVLQFLSTCTADGGTTCMSAEMTPCTPATVQSTGGSSLSCSRMALSCTWGRAEAASCSSNLHFAVISTK